MAFDTTMPGQEAEAFLDVVFPEDVRASYLIHDGQAPDGPCLIDAWQFLSLERIRSEWKVWKDLLDGREFLNQRSEPDEWGEERLAGRAIITGLTLTLVTAGRRSKSF